jgi:hypothetical protein
MVRICIDTNRFIDLYETDEDVSEIYSDIRKARSHLVLPDIISDEFLRNRGRILDRRMKDLKNTTIPDIRWPFFLLQTRSLPLWQQRYDEYNQAVLSVLSDIEMMIADVERDPIASAFVGLMRDPEVTVLSRTDLDIERAHRRKLIGNPPKSDDTPTIGDELIWEMILAHVRDDLVLVTRDYTYRNHVTFLASEYREKTGEQLYITEYISDGLQRVGEQPSESLLRFEGKKQNDS